MLINTEGLYVLDNMNGLREPKEPKMSPEQTKEFQKANINSPLTLVRYQMAKMRET